jgi:hemerythrin-like domain-containing protein
MQLHAELDEVFALHQEALVLLDFELAGELLAAYVRLLKTHMRHEEQLILPIFERAGPIARWPVNLYTGQHEKMLRLLEEAGSSVIALRKLEHGRRRGAIALITNEASYQHLVEHHDGAERQGLYAVVDETATPEEQAHVLEQVRSEWHDAFEREAALLERTRQRLG